MQSSEQICQEIYNIITTKQHVYKKSHPYQIFTISADTVNTFKNRLDKFWCNQDVLYDYTADLHGIGNRSIV